MRFPVGALTTLARVTEPRHEHGRPDAHWRLFTDWQGDPELRAELERLRAEMVQQLAPAADGPVVNPGASAPRQARVRRRDRVTGHRDGGDLEALRLELDRTAEIPDATEQMLEIAGVVDAALRSIAIRPIVVGGLAVAYWTTGLYLTSDIDVVMPPSARHCA